MRRQCLQLVAIRVVATILAVRETATIRTLVIPSTCSVRPACVTSRTAAQVWCGTSHYWRVTGPKPMSCTSWGGVPLQTSPSPVVIWTNMTCSHVTVYRVAKLDYVGPLFVTNPTQPTTLLSTTTYWGYCNPTTDEQHQRAHFVAIRATKRHNTTLQQNLLHIIHDIFQRNITRRLAVAKKSCDCCVLGRVRGCVPTRICQNVTGRRYFEDIEVFLQPLT